MVNSILRLSTKTEQISKQIIVFFISVYYCIQKITFMSRGKKGIRIFPN